MKPQDNYQVYHLFPLDEDRKALDAAMRVLAENEAKKLPFYKRKGFRKKVR